MALETEIKAKIVAGVDKASFRDGINYARDNGKKIDQELRKKLELNLVEFQVQLDQARQKLRQAKKEGDKEAIINAQLNVNRLSDGVTLAKGKLKNLSASGDETVSSLQLKFNQLGNSIGNAFKKVGGALASLGIMTFFKGVINEAIEAERQVAQMEAAIKSTGGTVGLTGKEIQQMNTDLGKMNGLDNDVVASTSNMLLTFTQVRGDTFKEATQAVIDLATAMNGGLLPSSQELAKSSIQVGKALNDPIKGITALKKVGVTFTEEQKKQIENFIKGGEVAKAQAVILAELNKEFGGSASAQINTYGGAMNALKVSIGELKETLGAALIPVLQKVIAFLRPVIDNIKVFIEQNPKLASVLGITTIAVTALATAVAFLGGPFTLIIAGVIALTGGVIGATNALQRMTNTIQRYRAGLQDAEGNLTDLGRKFQQFEEETQKLTDKVNAGVDAMDRLRLMKINQSATRAEFRATKEEAIKLGNEAIIAAKKLMAMTNTISAIGTIPGVGQGFGGLSEINKVGQSAQLQSLNKKLNDTMNMTRGGGPSGGGISGGKKAVNELEQAFKDAFTSINKDIDDSAKKIDDYKKEIDDLNLKISELGAKKDKDIASRVASIDAELAKTGEQAVSADERAKLEKERAEAFVGLTQTEIEALNKKIEAQTAYNNLSDIGKIKADYEVEKAVLDQKLVEAQTRLTTEQAFYQGLLDGKAKMDADYTAKFKTQIDAQKASMNTLITKYQEVANAARAAALAMASVGGGNVTPIPGMAIGGPVSAGSPYIVGEKGPELFVPNQSGKIVPNNQMTNNFNINANVSNDIELEKLANALAKKVALSRKGIF